MVDETTMETLPREASTAWRLGYLELRPRKRGQMEQQARGSLAPATAAEADSDLREPTARIIKLLAERPRALYIWGPAASGKTMLAGQVRQILSDQGWKSVFVVLDEASTPDSIRRDLVRSAPFLAASGMDADWQRVVDLVNAQSETAPVLLGLDQYDAVWSWDEWLRRNVLERLANTVTVIMTGRQPPARIWAGNHLWRERVATYRVTDLSRDEVGRHLTSLGITEPSAHDAVYQVSAGRIGFVARAADALTSRDLETARRILTPSASDAEGPISMAIVSFLVEQVLHPGSRRDAWRAGAGRESVDLIVAAASIVPYFRRNLLQLLVERSVVEPFWAQAVELPIIRRYEGGYYALEEPLRTQIEALVRQTRPWSAARWRHIARGYLISQLDKDDAVNVEASWASLVHLMTRGPGVQSNLASARPSTWTVEWLVDPDSVTPSPLHPKPGDVLTVPAEAVMVARALVLRGPAGDIVAGARVRRGRATEWGALAIIDHVAWTGSESDAPLAILIELAKEWIHEDVVIWDDRELGSDGVALRQQLDAWGFERGAVPGVAEMIPVLDFRARPFRVWLQQLAIQRTALPDPEPLANMAREALLAASDPESLMNTELARRYVGVNPGASLAAVRTWILDALASANLGDVPSGRALLTAYYLDRYGSHEMLAEHFHVSRATYFRSHRRALELLGTELWRYA